MFRDISLFRPQRLLVVCRSLRVSFFDALEDDKRRLRRSARWRSSRSGRLSWERGCFSGEHRQSRAVGPVSVQVAPWPCGPTSNGSHDHPLLGAPLAASDLYLGSFQAAFFLSASRLPTRYIMRNDWRPQNPSRNNK